MAWLIPQTNEEKYVKACRDYVDNDVDFFTNPDYTNILAGGGDSVAKTAMDSIKKFDYKLTGNETSSELRYINSALEIMEFAKDAKTVIEIGGGYGGLCEALFKMKTFDYYDMVDLPEASEVAYKYLSKYNYPIRFNEKFREYDLFIADSSVAELDLDTQRGYFNQAIKSKYAYIVYNTLHTFEGTDGYIQMLKQFINFDYKCIHARNPDGSVVPNVYILTLWRL